MKTHLTYILVIAAFAAAAFYFFDRNRKNKNTIERHKSALKEKDDSLHHTVNKLGQSVAEKSAAEVNLKEAKEFYAKEFEQIRKEIGIKNNDVKAFVQAQFAAHGQGTTTINYIQQPADSSGAGSVERGTFSINDGYLLLDGLLDSTKVDYKYTYQDEILYAFHVKKKNIFAKEELYGSGRLKNENAKITNSTSVLINDYKDKRFGVMVGGGYDPFQGPTIGIFVGYNLIKF